MLFRQKENREAEKVERRNRRKLDAYDLGKRFSIEEKLCHDVFQLEQDITQKIEEALKSQDYGKIGAYLKDFYTRVCELIDEAKSELVKTGP